MRRIWTLGATLSVSLVFVVSVEAKTIRLNWTESTFGSGNPLLVFKVQSVTITGRTWSVRASVTNRSGKRLRIVRGLADPYRGLYGFGILAPTSCSPGASSCPPLPLLAAAFAPAQPPMLSSGEQWAGVFRGEGTLPRKRILNITFGRFVAPGGKSFHWVTEHSFRLAG